MIIKQILIVEDEDDILELISYNLKKEQYQILEAKSGELAIKQALQHIPDLILLDLMLPGIDGFTVCRHLRESPQTCSIPIIMLTAKGEEADIVTGLELGADDYITKPFSPRVLVARIKAVLRRKINNTTKTDDIITRGSLVIDPGRHQVLLDQKQVQLTSTEFRILKFLAARPGWVFTRNQIVQAIHDADFAVTPRAVDVQVVGLRKKLGKNEAFIETVRGVGYKFKE